MQVHIADWYATLCHLAGVDPSDPSAQQAGLPDVDSINQWPLISGTHNGSLRTNIYLSRVAYIDHNYKIITGNNVPPKWKKMNPSLKPGEVPFAGYWPGYGIEAPLKTLLARQDCSHGCLYDIASDPYEHHDLAAQLPEVAARMKSSLDELNQGIFLPDRGNQSDQACQVGVNRYGGFYGPFLNL